MLQIIRGNRQERMTSFSEVIEKETKAILARVEKEGDAALRDYTYQFDSAKIEEFLVTEAEYETAWQEVDKPLLEALQAAKENIEEYHKLQLNPGYEIKEEGKLRKEVIVPIEKVGIYVPGGKAAYPSTVLMNAIPAQLANVGEITMVTPPDASGKVKSSLLVAAKLAGVTRVLKVGGAQSIAALTYGTETIEKVDKIVGPGNAYVAMAKKLVSGEVGIDMIAGPTEVVIIADETANPTFVVADLMAQAEHDEIASSIVITTSEKLAEAIMEKAKEMVPLQPRREIITASFTDYGGIFLVDFIEEAIELANDLAPEHLEIMTKDPFQVYPKIKHAGAIFLGAYTPESVGDYYAGANHTLPTNRTARFSSPLGVPDFQKRMSVIYFSEEVLKASREHIELIAKEEGLYAHGYAVSVRFEEKE